MYLFSIFRRQRQADFLDFEANLLYIWNDKTAKTKLCSDNQSKKQAKKKKSDFQN